jgi:hypothetical protein
MMIFCFITSVGYLVDSISKIKYSEILGKQEKMLNLDIIIDSFDIILISIWIFNDVTNIHKSSDLLQLSLILSGILGLQWLRTLICFKVSRIFTPMITIIGAMVQELVKFFFLAGIIFIMFLAIGNILLYDCESFSTLENGAVFLFSAGLGVFDFKDVFKAELPTIGYIYLTIYLLFMAMILINFIIAILTETMMGKLSKAMFLRQVILLQ